MGSHRKPTQGAGGNLLASGRYYPSRMPWKPQALGLCVGARLGSWDGCGFQMEQRGEVL